MVRETHIVDGVLVRAVSSRNIKRREAFRNLVLRR